MTRPRFVFRAIWPIIDGSRSIEQLRAEAQAELSRLTVQSHARVTGPGRWTIAPSAAVPGSGNVSANVLMYEAPAEEQPRTWDRLPAELGATA